MVYQSGVDMTKHTFFPTCQLRVVSFYHSCSGSSSSSFSSTSSSSSSFSSTTSASTPTSTSALPTLRSSPTSARSWQCWTSTAGFRSEMGTAGPQPQGSERSGHRCSTWDLPSSVGTAGPQRPDGMPEYMPERLPEYMPDRQKEYMPHRMPKYMRERMPHRMPEYMPDKMLEDMPDKMVESVPEDTQDRSQKEDLPDKRPEGSDTECQKILQIEYKIMSNRIFTRRNVICVSLLVLWVVVRHKGYPSNIFKNA